MAKALALQQLVDYLRFLTAFEYNEIKPIINGVNQFFNYSCKRFTAM
jgi:hypothetical protein